MELQFPKNAFGYLRRAVWEMKNDEQTQEVRLADSFPDIGKILGTWGQPLVRSKEWLGSSMRISGGVMAWILYAPEEGGAPKCVETWIPFQLHWDFPQAQHDGTMRVSCQMKGIDSRSVSARKIMVRSLVSAVGEALEPVQTELYRPDTVPEDVQIRRESYPICLPSEAGESVITLDEELTPNGSGGQVNRMIYCSVEPVLSDQKVMADKVVYRGSAGVHLLCECENAQLCGFDFEVPFSQYVQLEREYDPCATADVIPAMTNLEVDVQENGTLRLKAGIVGQYVVYDRPVLEIVTDAYSTQRPVTLQQQRLVLPAVLDMGQETIRVEAPMDAEVQLADAALLMSHPLQYRDQQKIRTEIPGSFQILGYGNDGTPIGSSVRWEKELEIPVDGSALLLTGSRQKGKPQTAGAAVSCDIAVDMLVTAPTDIPMVTALELGELAAQDPNKPSMILRRAGGDTLWDIAKTCGSTVDAIWEANGLTEEPAEDQVLLIPVS